MFVDVQTEVLIQRPVPEVAEFSADPANAPRWYVNIKAVEWRSEPGVQVGARAAFVAQFLGRRMAYTYEIAEYVPGELLVMRTAEGPFPMETTYAWEATPKGTRMRLRNRGEPKGFASLMAPMMRSAMRRANQKDLALLKQILESA